MHMKNKNIYRDTVRWMLLPVLSNVIYEVLKLSMVFIVAYFLGRVTDAAIAGKYDVFLDKGKVLLLIIAIGQSVFRWRRLRWILYGSRQVR